MEIVCLPCFAVDAAPISKAVLVAASVRATTICCHCLLLVGTAASALAMQHHQPFPVCERRYHNVVARHSSAQLATVLLALHHHSLRAASEGSIWEIQTPWPQTRTSPTPYQWYMLSASQQCEMIVEEVAPNTKHRYGGEVLWVPGTLSVWSSTWDLLPETPSLLLDAIGPAGKTALWRDCWKLLVPAGPEASLANKWSTGAELYTVLCHITAKSLHYSLEAQKLLLIFFTLSDT